jgi:hypothetical protein
MFYVDQIVVSLMTPKTAQWLIDQQANALIRELAPYCYGDIREMLRPYSEGIIDAQDAQGTAYREEEAKREESRVRHISSLQASLLSRTSLNDALKDLWELKEDYWPELPNQFRDWLASEVSKCLGTLDLEKNIEWKENTLWTPQILSFLMKVIDRYGLRIEPDEPFAFATMAMDAGIVARHVNRFPFSETALKTIERLLKNPPSNQALERSSVSSKKPTSGLPRSRKAWKRSQLQRTTWAICNSRR